MLRILNSIKTIKFPTIDRLNFIHTSAANLKGHAKWQNIKQIKTLKDSQRATLINKNMRIIRLAVQEGGGSIDPNVNNVLNHAMNEALRQNVPKATILAGLKKLSQESDKSKIQRHIYDVKLYNKLFLIIAVYTDNLALTKNQLAYPFKKHKVDIKGTRHAFTERGVINAIARPEVRADHFEDDCLNDAIECGAEEIEVHDAEQKQVTFLCDPNDFIKVKTKLTALNYQIEHSECVFIPKPNIMVRLNSNEIHDYKLFLGRLQEVEGLDEIYDNIEDDEQ